MVRTTHDGLSIAKQDIIAGAQWHVVLSPRMVGGVCGEYVEKGDEKNARARLYRRARALLKD